jgi:hypothetical protein
VVFWKLANPTAATLVLLASCRDGRTEAIIQLIDAGLATAKAERVFAGTV